MVCRKLAACVVIIEALLFGSAAGADEGLTTPVEIPQYAPATHLGVASCASSVCHGRVEKSDTSRVWLTEYRVWQSKDAHARSYETLRSQASLNIAKKLGIADPTKADVCLDCHADNVAMESRGPRFQISDGVGCEACHGGSQNWISSHTEANSSYQENLAQGLFPTAEPATRAQLCLSCHLGDDHKFANHDIMGSGHPQLLFDLAAFSINQPMHYSADADYVNRKGSFGPIDFWLYGLTESASTNLEMLKTPALFPAGAFPELAYYQCDSCHRKTDQSTDYIVVKDPLLPAGVVPLNDTIVRLLLEISLLLDIEGAETAIGQLDSLMIAASLKPQEVKAKAAVLGNSIASIKHAITHNTLTVTDLESLRIGLLTLATGDQVNYFSYAFSVFLAVNHVNAALDDDLLPRRNIQKWFKSVSQESEFDRQEFAMLAETLLRPVARRLSVASERKVLVATVVNDENSEEIMNSATALANAIKPAGTETSDRSSTTSLSADLIRDIDSTSTSEIEIESGAAIAESQTQQEIDFRYMKVESEGIEATDGQLYDDELHDDELYGDELYGEESHNGEYIVVAGGFQSVQNAKKLIDKLKLLGFEAHLSGFSSTGLNRVAYGSYKNSSEALKAMRWIQSTHNAQAWMTTK